MLELNFQIKKSIGRHFFFFVGIKRSKINLWSKIEENKFKGSHFFSGQKRLAKKVTKLLI